MSVLSEIRGCLDKVGLPYAPDIYAGSETTYIVYDIATEDPDHYVDDVPQTNTVYFQIHLYIPKDKNYLSYQKNIKTSLVERGFSYPSVAINTIDTQTKIRHICYETNIAESEA